MLRKCLLSVYPIGLRTKLMLWQRAEDLSHRFTKSFLRDEQGRQAGFCANMTFQNDLHWGDYIPCHEYCYSQTGRGVGAAYQTG